MEKDITILIVTIILFIVTLAYVRHLHDKEYQIWFEEVEKVAGAKLDVDFFWNFFCCGYTPAEAVEKWRKEYL